MGLLRPTPLLRFYKSGKTNRMSNPMRRWVYHYIFFGVLGGFGGYQGFRYARAGWEAATHPEDGNCLCSSEMVDALFFLPFNTLSNSVGRLAENLYLPTWMHHAAADALIRWCKVDMSESVQQVRDVETFQQFYTRDWTPEARSVSAGAAVVAPCDGVLLSVHSNVRDMTLVQVKGLSYGIRVLLQETPPPLDAERYRRVAAVIHMRNKDFHHVVAPLSFRCEKSVYVPGALFPVTAAGFHWIPSVLTINERLVLCGTSADRNKLPVYMALVGSTLTGRIKFYLDQRVRTNYLEPPEYALHNTYASKPLLAKGERVATFNWGSSVVLLVDVPKDCAVLKRAGEEVKAGEALIQC
ncbi:putative mitochondrial Phosphatidylserine decarboxylase [Leptomonas pyrrhocoris]|uniref:phosphatidylserine decarboxylase n=1 Tax=Leptomonas pyrrhocoris TaxID=157538 RepID=A0A0N1J5H0_LEPPY|nr:putative mitochondrial Phosphatidylserine decarboxylase [Leptomonas pyrrhocoris]KPA86564.1 putative mitochondrial Phosphatidylserine decarboxylase [Leptomonas pyrrhocoris]|eukprot:XP_015665003.1 putative mitochondrial Phosphatidylserine decarboxylase [Leptomonas pyrrhocoris]